MIIVLVLRFIDIFINCVLWWSKVNVIIVVRKIVGIVVIIFFNLLFILLVIIEVNVIVILLMIKWRIVFLIENIFNVFFYN